jgi:ATP synthase protein I
VLKVALPRPSSDAVIRGDGRSASHAAFADEEETPVRRLTRDEAAALRQREPTLSPWRVVSVQAALGVLVAIVAWLASGSQVVAMSALYGAAVVALPGALMARGTTSRLSSLSPLISTMSMMGWQFVKMAAAVSMLALAPHIVPGLVWPAMLASLVVCLQTYWLALLWRGRSV